MFPYPGYQKLSYKHFGTLGLNYNSHPHEFSLRNMSLNIITLSSGPSFKFGFEIKILCFQVKTKEFWLS